MTKKQLNVIVGCGFSGATLARKLVEESSMALIVDTRTTIGGNCYDYYDESNICVHNYGAHIFHTSLKHVWDFLGRFTEWHPYMHRVRAVIDGIETPIPFNLNSLRLVFPKSLADRIEEKLLAKYPYNTKVPILELRKTGDPDLEFLATYVYEKVFLPYTLKQWGLTPEELDPSVTGRVPVFVGRDDRYFQDRYQGIPAKGYSALIENMLDHPNITVQLNTSFEQIKNDVKYDRLFYTGSIDAFFDYRFGPLPYRSVRFDFAEYDVEQLQPVAVVNYPENYDFTRCIEFKHFLGDISPKTVVAWEFPEPFRQGENDPAYPIIKDENHALFEKYRRLADELPNAWFLGRLGDYRYYDMDKAVARALDVFESVKKDSR